MKVKPSIKTDPSQHRLAQVKEELLPKEGRRLCDHDPGDCGDSGMSMGAEKARS